ncbi:MAG: alpha-amylase family glycosyl hydrolase [Thiotrichales bacterium]
MAQVTVTFEVFIGIHRPVFSGARLTGSWSDEGVYSSEWLVSPMEAYVAEDGCAAWRTTIELDSTQIEWRFQWGVLLTDSVGLETWGIATESGTFEHPHRHREFILRESGQTEQYWIAPSRRFGANKRFRAGEASPSLVFSVWAPHAQSVETVFGDSVTGYIWNDGRGVVRALRMARDAFGVWHTDPNNPDLADFSRWDHQPYMFRMTRSDGSVAYRTDLYSRCQIGSGKHDPEISPQSWNGCREDLDGTKSCSVVVDPERVTKHFSEPVFPETEWVSEEDFWANEFDPLLPLPLRVEELVIYELHVGALGFGKEGPGTLEDAIDLLDHLVDLGINAIELLPISEFEGWANWGYGTSHFYAIEYTGGGRDQFKYFVRACHRRGIAVILDVVYNHYTHDGERAAWMYDSARHDENSYYWYEGSPQNYPTGREDGGYLDNGSTGYSPNFREELVRGMLIGSAVTLLTEFHVDGFRVDLTQAIHRDHVRHYDGQPVAKASQFGARFLREWSRTLRLIDPGVMLLAEDHTDWAALTQPLETGGIGFDAVWWAEWYHHLIGDATNDASKARVLHTAGHGGEVPLALDRIANGLIHTPGKVIYHESHDEAGNSSYVENGQRHESARTLRVAVNAELNETTRRWAEARVRVVAGLTLLAGGTPMIFMGEEVGAEKPYRYRDFLENREDIEGLRNTSGARLFEFYRDLVRLRRGSTALRGPLIDIIHVHNANRVIAFRRAHEDEEFIVVASLNNRGFDHGYNLSDGALRGRTWAVIVATDDPQDETYNTPERREVLPSLDGTLTVRLGACSLLVLKRVD